MPMIRTITNVVMRTSRNELPESVAIDVTWEKDRVRSCPRREEPGYGVIWPEKTQSLPDLVPRIENVKLFWVVMLVTR
jgi:hypothetical protein